MFCFSCKLFYKYFPTANRICCIVYCTSRLQTLVYQSNKGFGTEICCSSFDICTFRFIRYANGKLILIRISSGLHKQKPFKQALAFSSIKMADQKFKEEEIIPDVLKIAPNKSLHVKYASGVEVSLGNILTPRQVKDQPNVSWEAEEKELYTLCMTDPDAPSRKEPTKREINHWLVVNIPGNRVQEGQVLTEFVGSGPPEGSGLHRYIFLAYKQPGKISPDEKHIDNHTAGGRANFKIQAFAEKYKLGDPVAGNFYLAEWDDYVPEMRKRYTA